MAVVSLALGARLGLAAQVLRSMGTEWLLLPIAFVQAPKSGWLCGWS